MTPTQTAKLAEIRARLSEAMNHHGTYEDSACALVRPSDLAVVLDMLDKPKEATPGEREELAAKAGNAFNGWMGERVEKGDKITMADCWNYIADALISAGWVKGEPT